MDSEVAAAIVGGVAGFATGAVSSIIAPWSNWGVEKRRIRHNRRIDMVEEWRQGLYTAERGGDLGILNDFEWYRKLASKHRPARVARLKRSARKLIPKKWRKVPTLITPPSRTMVVSDAGSRTGAAIEAENEINRIARNWGID